MRGAIPLVIGGTTLSPDEITNLKIHWDQLFAPDLVDPDVLTRAMLGGTVLVKHASTFMIQKDYDLAVLVMCNEVVKRYTW